MCAPADFLSPAHQSEPRRGQFVSSSPFDSDVRGAGEPLNSIEGQHPSTGGSMGRGLLRFHDMVSVLEPAEHLADVVPEYAPTCTPPLSTGSGDSSCTAPQDQPTSLPTAPDASTVSSTAFG